MINQTRLQTGLPRRLTVYYLFFCLAAVCWLAVGVVLTTQSVFNSRSEHAALSLLGKTASTFEVEHVRRGAENFQDLIARLKTEGRLAYCSIVGIDGKYVAHSSPGMVGKTAVAPSGVRSRWGEIEGISFTDDKARPIREYHLPLQANHSQIGVLRAGTLEPGMWDTMLQAAELAPAAIMVPLMLIVAGAVVLSRQAKPLSGIDGELRRIARIPMGETIEPQMLPPRTGAALGWNRVVEELQELRASCQRPDPATRLADLAISSRQTGSEAILTHLPDGIAVTDDHGVVTQANPAMAALLGHNGKVQELLGSSIEQHLPSKDAALALAELSTTANRQRAVTAEITCHSGVDERSLRFARHPWRNEDGSLRGYLWSVRDVSQQKLAEKMRDQFIAAATHELRTPLANIKAYAETLAATDELDLESQREFCNTMNSEATRLARFVDDLLSVSSMEAGGLSIEPQNVEMGRLFKEVVDKVEPLLRAKSIAFEVELPAKLPELSLDKDKIVASLVNLLGNAAKYTPSGGKVGLRVKTIEDRIQIQVDDTGIGISTEELPKVFDKFFRSVDSRVREQTGTGLGLSLAQELIRLHDGSLTVTSQLNQGSTFSISLPLKAR